MKKVCNFCGRSEREVRLLITGINGYICEDCSRQAYQIVKESGLLDGNQEERGDNDSKKAAKDKKVPKPREIKDYLDQYVIGQDDAKRFLSVAVYNRDKRLQQ